MTEQKDHADVKIHPPVLTVIFIVLAYLAKMFSGFELNVPLSFEVVGFGLVVVGFLLGLAAALEFRRARTTILPHGSVSNIIKSGIYRFTRNPIYLGFLCMVIGFPLNSHTLWGAVFAPFFVWLMNRLVIEAEEVYLEKKFGEEYTGYRSGVRRWL